MDDSHAEWSGNEINTDFTPGKREIEEGITISALWVDAHPEKPGQSQQGTDSRAQDRTELRAAWTRVQERPAEEQSLTQRGTRRGGG